MDLNFSFSSEVLHLQHVAVLLCYYKLLVVILACLASEVEDGDNDDISRNGNGHHSHDSGTILMQRMTRMMIMCR